MQVITGNIWHYWRQGHWIVIPTNGSINAQGDAVMGKGLAYQVKVLFPEFPQYFGNRLNIKGNRLMLHPAYKFITFPVKHKWDDMKASIALIEQSAKDLFHSHERGTETIYLPTVGCGNGNLDWWQVKDALVPWVDNNMFIVKFKRE